MKFRCVTIDGSAKDTQVEKIIHFCDCLAISWKLCKIGIYLLRDANNHNQNREMNLYSTAYNTG